MTPVLFLDVSRLMRRLAGGGGPTGIDRIELAYAAWAMRQSAMTPIFVARRARSLARLRAAAAPALLETLSARWSEPEPDAPDTTSPWFAGSARRAIAAQSLFALSTGSLAANGAPSVYLNVGHDGLDVPDRLRAVPGATAAVISDIIPITHPEYDTERATALHEARMATLAAHADHVFTISAATRDAIAAAYPSARFSTSVAHLAGGLPKTERVVPTTPTFVHLSSIDRRKNVPLLLHIWRAWAERGERVPRLVLVGRSGNDQTAMALIERCAAIAPHVAVTGPVADSEAAAHLASATALLSPTFVEGFGLPVVEARALGVPVIASDIAAHREVGGPSTVFIDPLDGAAWAAAIAKMSVAPPAVRPETLPGWEAHFATVLPTLLAIAR